MDACTRHGCIHWFFGVLVQPGISDIIMDSLDWLQQNNYITLLVAKIQQWPLSSARLVK